MWVIENVPRAPIRSDIRLDGSMFGLKTHRERWFETSGWLALQLCPGRRFGMATRDDAVLVTGHPGKQEQGRRLHAVSGRLYHKHNGTVEEWEQAMGIDWMHSKELAQAIPPAYSEHIGRYAMMALGRIEA